MPLHPNLKTRDLLSRLIAVSNDIGTEQVIVRIVTRDKNGSVISARQAPISYFRTVDNNTEAICIEANELVDSSSDI